MKYKFHDTILSSIIQHALTLLLLMKSARSLMLLRWKESQQWDQRFTSLVSGEHGCIGGGTRAYRGLSDAALLWMMDMINSTSWVRVWPLVEDRNKVNHKTPFDNTPSIVYIITGLIDHNVVEEWIVNPTTEQLETKPVKFEDLRVKARWRDCTDYQGSFQLTPLIGSVGNATSIIG